MTTPQPPAPAARLIGEQPPVFPCELFCAGSSSVPDVEPSWIEFTHWPAGSVSSGWIYTHWRPLPTAPSAPPKFAPGPLFDTFGERDNASLQQSPSPTETATPETDAIFDTMLDVLRRYDERKVYFSDVANAIYSGKCDARSLETRLTTANMETVRWRDAAQNHGLMEMHLKGELTAALAKAEWERLRAGDSQLIKALAEDVGIEITASDSSPGAQWEQFHSGVTSLRTQLKDMTGQFIKVSEENANLKKQAAMDTVRFREMQEVGIRTEVELAALREDKARLDVLQFDDDGSSLGYVCVRVAYPLEQGGAHWLFSGVSRVRDVIDKALAARARNEGRGT